MIAHPVNSTLLSFGHSAGEMMQNTQN